MNSSKYLVAHLFLCAIFASAQDRAAGVLTASLRARHLLHGINASEWFSQSPTDYTVARTSRYTDATDITLMAKLGFDHVRLSIDPVPLEQHPVGKEGFNEDFLGRVDAVVDAILANGMAVQIDIHPEDPYKLQVRSSKEGADRFVWMWSRLARHYASRDPERVFFEIMNEPEETDPYRWEGVQMRVTEAIRRFAPKHTVIATGPNYSGMFDLLSVLPLLDGNVIYNFHFYEPMQFTHQGASWDPSWGHDTHDIPYPATEESMPAVLQQLSDPEGRYQLEDYWLSRWDAHRIHAEIDEAAAWARENGVPLICNEFGAYREHTDPRSRFNWIHDVRVALEDNSIGWTMWDYRGGFGVVWKSDGQPARVDENVLMALGLKRR